jgi:hypothetical protein
MHKSRSANKSPHVGSRERDYLRPDEANALIEAAGKVGRQPPGARQSGCVRGRSADPRSRAEPCEWRDGYLKTRANCAYQVTRTKPSLAIAEAGAADTPRFSRARLLGSRLAESGLAGLECPWQERVFNAVWGSSHEF